MSSDLKRGRAQFLEIVASMLALVLLLSVSAWLRGAESNLLLELGRPAVFSALAILAYRGADWARALLVLWSGLLALACGVGAISIGFASPMWMLLTVAFAAGVAYYAFQLATSDTIDAFLTTQRSRTRSSGPAA